MPGTLVILGASARAAAQSAMRAGFRPACGDLFADLDTSRLGPALATYEYPHGLASLSRQLPAGPWIYTGGLENYPRLVDTIAHDRPLLGNAGDVLRAVRDPLRVTAVLERAGLAVPECRASSAGLLLDGSWLCKRRRSSGGIGVRRWQGRGGRTRDAYFQQCIEGDSCAALFVAARGRATLMGVTHQVLSPENESDAFHYRGSLGPCRLSIECEESWRQIGSVLAAEFGLQGLFGVDAIIDRQERVWPVEVNPRYTASVEVLERGLGVTALTWHTDACREGRLPDNVPRTTGTWHGKLVVYARSDLRVEPNMCESFEELNAGSTWPSVADLPAPGSYISAGQPILTIFAEAESCEAVGRKLLEREQELLSELGYG